MFKLHAALMWTISDFPGLGNLSGWNTYTGLACPTCNFDSVPCRLPHSKKWCFMGHRRFLDHRHRFRLNRVRFNGEQDMRNPPKMLSGSEIFEQVKNINVTFGQTSKVGVRGKRSRGEGRTTQDVTQQWKKKSILFELPYWEYNLIRHNLDVMHIEKNVCDNIIYTLLNDGAKSKDHIFARRDLQSMNCKHELWPDESGKYPFAVYTMTKQEKKSFLTTLKNITVPDGYSSNFSRCIDVENQKLFHALGSKTLARTQHELETQTGRSYSRAEMFSIAYTTKDGNFVSDEAREKNVQLSLEEEMSPGDDNYARVFGKEHPGRVRGVGFGPVPSEWCHKAGNGSSSKSNNTITSFEVERLKSELQDSNARVKVLEEQMAFIMRHLGGQMPNGFNQDTDLGSPMEVRPSSSATHAPSNQGPSTTI